MMAGVFRGMRVFFIVLHGLAFVGPVFADELAGNKLFNNPRKGNYVACHEIGRAHV